MGNLKWKINYFSYDLYKKILILNTKGSLSGKNKILFSKSNRIVNRLVNKKISIYKGFFFRNLFVSKFIIGCKFGEFALTRKPFKYVLKSKKDSKF